MRSTCTTAFFGHFFRLLFGALGHVFLVLLLDFLSLGFRV
jgi:hypothetical protein